MSTVSSSADVQSARHLRLQSQEPKAVHEQNIDKLRARFDSVVMLTWSNWKTEPRSNRYHYARRLSEILPVIFVQPDCDDTRYSYEATELPGVTLLHVSPEGFTQEDRHIQTAQIRCALADRKIRKPLLWVYNSNMVDFVESCFAPLKVYHATEDYLDDDKITLAPQFRARLHRVLANVDVLLSVSHEIEDLYVNKGRFQGERIVATNGCDFQFLSKRPTDPVPTDRKVAIYQGGINYRLDFDLLLGMARELPDWTFRLCGSVMFGREHQASRRQWEALRSLPNVEYLGLLDADAVRSQLHRATVGLIPFVLNRTLIERSFPLKAFEYIACGLPVVTVPIKALERWPQLFHYARTVDTFVDGIRMAAASRFDGPLLAQRREQAHANSYDRNFEVVCERLVQIGKRKMPPGTRYNLLLLYDTSKSVDARALQRYSRHAVAPLCVSSLRADLGDVSRFDAIIIDSSVNLTNHFDTEHFRHALSQSSSLKLALLAEPPHDIQAFLRSLEEIGIHRVHASTRLDHLQDFAAQLRNHAIDFVAHEPGFVTEEFEPSCRAEAASPRPYMLGCLNSDDKASSLQESELESLCQSSNTAIAYLSTQSPQDDVARGLVLRQCQAVIWDTSNSPARSTECRKSIDKTPDIIAPILEIIASNCVLILKGETPKHLAPDIHYLSLNADYSNFYEVTEKLKDPSFVETLTENAYAEIVAPLHSQAQFNAEAFDQDIETSVGPGRGFRPQWDLVGFVDREGRHLPWCKFGGTGSSAVAMTESSWKKHARLLWRQLPEPARQYLKPILVALFSGGRQLSLRVLNSRRHLLRGLTLLWLRLPKKCRQELKQVLWPICVSLQTILR